MYKSFYLVISVIIFELLYTGCISKSDNNNIDDKFTIYCEQNLRKEPKDIIRKIDSVISIQDNGYNISELMMLKAKGKFLISEYDSANLIVDSVIKLTGDESDISIRNKVLANAYNTLGNIYSRKIIPDSAISCYKKAYYYSSYFGPSTSLVNISINMADAYLRSGKFDKGAYWYRKSLYLSDTLMIPEKERFPSFYGLGHVYTELRDFSLSDYYYDKAGKYFDSMLPYEKHFYLNNRGNSYYFREDYNTALKYFRQSQTLVNSREDMEFERNLTMVNLGEIFILLNNVDSASYYLNKCYPFFKSINSASALYYIETQLIELALKQGNINEARRIISESVNPGFIEPNMQHIRNKYLQHYFEKSGDYKKAYYFHNKNIKLDDSIRNEKIKMRASDIYMRYKQDSILMMKEFSIKEKESELKLLHQWIYLLVLGILFILAISLSYLIYKKRINDKRIWNLKTDINSLRLENVRNRISPHFIFNVLNREMIKHSDKSEKDNLLNLSKLIRKNLEITDNHCITLKDELDFVKDYISIEKQGITGEFNYNVEIAKNIDINNTYIPSMFIQIPVENAIKHSLRMKDGKKNIWINAEIKNDETEIRITDNGGGFKAKSINRGTETGLKVITQSIQLLNLNNKRHITMKISNKNLENSEIGCEVKFSIPMNFKYKIR